MGAEPHTHILDRLRSCPEAWVSGELLGQDAGISRAAVSKRIRKLQSLGYTIESRSRKGYRLMSEPQDLRPEHLAIALRDLSFYQHPFHIHQETGSTNDDVRRLAESGAPEGTVVFSERQEIGRGRRGREWFAAPGEALLFSLLLRPPIPPGQGTLIPLLAATAVYRALRRLGVEDVGIKWPNDVLIGNRKLCGILCEMSVTLEGIEFAILGMGLNVSTPEDRFPEDLRETACSLRSATGSSWDRKQVWVAVLEELEPLIQDLWSGHVESVLQGWREGAVTPGQHIQVTCADGSTVKGEALGVTGEGALRLLKEDGTEQVFHSGEVTLRPPAAG